MNQYWKIINCSPYFIQVSVVFTWYLFSVLEFHQDTTLHLVFMSPKALFGWSCFWGPWPFWGVFVRHFLECPLLEFGVFAMIGLVLWILGRKATEVKCHFHHITSGVRGVSMILTLDVHWSSGWDRTPSGYCSPSPLFSKLCFWEGSYMWPSLKEWGWCVVLNKRI